MFLSDMLFVSMVMFFIIAVISIIWFIDLIGIWFFDFSIVDQVNKLFFGWMDK